MSFFCLSSLTFDKNVGHVRVCTLSDRKWGPHSVNFVLQIYNSNLLIRLRERICDRFLVSLLVQQYVWHRKVLFLFFFLYFDCHCLDLNNFLHSTDLREQSMRHDKCRVGFVTWDHRFVTKNIYVSIIYIYIYNE